MLYRYGNLLLHTEEKYIFPGLPSRHRIPWYLALTLLMTPPFFSFLHCFFSQNKEPKKSDNNKSLIVNMLMYIYNQKAAHPEAVVDPEVAVDGRFF